MNQLNCHLNTFGTCWTQELPVSQMKFVKINRIILGNNLNANTIPGNAVEAT